jgi:hypothetical protein
MTWEASGGCRAKLPSFISGDPNALSALLRSAALQTLFFAFLCASL